MEWTDTFHEYRKRDLHLAGPAPPANQKRTGRAQMPGKWLHFRDLKPTAGLYETVGVHYFSTTRTKWSWRVPSAVIPGTKIAFPHRFQRGAGSMRSSPRW